PAYETDGIRVRVVAGAFEGIAGPVTEIAASPLYLEVQMAPNRELVQPVPTGHTALAYLFEGEATFGSQTASAVQMIRFGDGDHIRAKTENSAARFMLIAGKPFGEPIAPYGPFVMNTREEIQQALSDLRNGTFIKVEEA
ncbi:MAG: pirin family protein, partial [Anaerolineae bacterium]